jgi:SAM-dependent methyltransferase
MDTRKSLLNSYNQAATEYVDAFYNELHKKPFDMELLQQFSKRIPTGSKVCDLGCGPGHITEYLYNLGVNVIGIDISENMIKLAKERNPSIRFDIGDMLDLNLLDESIGGAMAFYSIIHICPNLLGQVFSEICRILLPNGVFLFSCHFGTGVIEVDNWFEKGLKYHCYLYKPDELTGKLRKAGFSDVSVQIRESYGFEYETERIYIFAYKSIGLAGQIAS